MTPPDRDRLSAPAFIHAAPPADGEKQLPLIAEGATRARPAPADANRQLPLAFSRLDIYDFASYLPGANGDAVECLLNTALGRGAKNIYLWGKQGAGKSHLLQAACKLAAADQRPCAYVPLALLDDARPEILASLDELSLVCMDDLDAIAGKDEWEIAMFNLFNRLKDADIPLVMSARNSPSGLPVCLPDLKSRLAWDLSFRLRPMDESLKMIALKRRAEARGFALSDGVMEYLIRRVNRDTHNLFRWLDRLETHSLAAQKKLTVPFVKRILEEGGQTGAIVDEL